MKKSERRFILLSLTAAFCSGLLVFILDTFMFAQGEWGKESHYFLDEAKLIHYLVVPSLIFAMGMIWKNHISRGVRIGSKRVQKRSGYMMFISFLTLIVSGQLLLSITSSFARDLIGWIHLVIGGFVFSISLWHILRRGPNA